MKKPDILSILITFVVGVFAGGYLYLTGFASVEDKMSIPDAEELMEFTIVGEVYGGCELGNACPSFQVLKDGSYRYFYTPAVGIDQILRQGTLPRQLRRQVDVVMRVDDLTEQSEKIQPSFCNSYSDGIDVKYQVMLDGTEYLLYSCGTAVVRQGVLWVALGEIWTYFETLGANE